MQHFAILTEVAPGPLLDAHPIEGTARLLEAGGQQGAVERVEVLDASRAVQSRGFFSKEAGLKKAGCPLFCGKLLQKRSRQSAGLRHALEMLSRLLAHSSGNR